MSTLSITNTVNPDMDEQIEAKVYLLLGSSMTSLRVMEAVLEGVSTPGREAGLVRCELRALERHGKWHLVSNEQHDLGCALEGALTRLRRSLARQRQQRRSV